MDDIVRDVIGEYTEEEPTLKFDVIGVGGAGNNTVNRLIRKGIGKMREIRLHAVNTDRQQLGLVHEQANKILIGESITRGLGAGGYPDVGRKAAEIDRNKLEKALEGSHMAFICAGMGGGTGTGAAPVIAEIAKEAGAITLAMVTYPFALERNRRVKADEGIRELRKVADSVIVIDNERLLQLFPNLPMQEAFAMADEILASAIEGLTWTITQPSMINIDFADVRAIMGNGDVGFIAVGKGSGADKVRMATEGVFKNRLLDVDFDGAKGALIHITGGSDLTLGDAIKVGEAITERMSPEANVKWGARIMPNYESKLDVVAIITGVKGTSIFGKAEEPVYSSDVDFLG